jgi:hypothetical protein
LNRSFKPGSTNINSPSIDLLHPTSNRSSDIIRMFFTVLKLI